MPEIAIVVPARLASVRFPCKLLFEIKGKPLILWTAERIAKQSPDIPLFFAVDDSSTHDLLQAHGFQPVMTASDHPSGTDRIAEANAKVGADYIINVQADEPMVTAHQIHTLAELVHGPVDIATLAVPFRTEEDFRDPNKVKVVLDNRGHALYFSRSPIPFARDHHDVGRLWPLLNRCYWHLGMYAYTAEFLEKFHQFSPGRLEQIEKLEQLRALENGFSIAVGITHEFTFGIDTPKDAAAFEKFLHS